MAKTVYEKYLVAVPYITSNDDDDDADDDSPTTNYKKNLYFIALYIKP